VNINGLLNILYCIEQNSSVDTFIFSSSASVYGDVSGDQEIKEDAPCNPKSTYGRTKLYIPSLILLSRYGEQIMRDFCHKYNGVFNPRRIDCIALRYFNPVGAHPSGYIFQFDNLNRLVGENPHQDPSSLMPIVCRVALGKYTHINVFGSDYDTKDGSGCRDFIHVMDVAQAHVTSLSKMSMDFSNFRIYNLGSESGIN
jgi:UDP-glucose 4-epimerase